MKKSLSTALLGLFLSTSLFGQSSNDTIKMFVNRPHSQELKNVLSFENIDYYYLTFVGKSLKGKSFYIKAKEIWNGEVKQESTVINTSDYDISVSSDTLKITVISKKLNEDKIKTRFKFPWLETTSIINATRSNNYSLRATGTNFDIVPNTKFYVLANILPYKKDNLLMYCAVESSGIDIEEWGTKFNIEHYVVYEMMFE